MTATIDGWVLIADGDPGFARVLQILLEEEGGCESSIADDASEISGLLSNRGLPLAAICNLEMRNPDGVPTISWLRRVHPDLPLVTTTAHPSAGSRARAGAAGVNAYLSKPIDPPELLRVLRRLLTQTQAAVPSSPPRPARPG